MRYKRLKCNDKYSKTQTILQHKSLKIKDKKIKYNGPLKLDAKLRQIKTLSSNMGKTSRK